MLPPELESPLPRLARLLVSRCALLVEGRLQEPVAEALVDVERVLDTGGLQLLVEGSHVLHPDPGILVTPLAEDRAAHLVGDLERRRRRQRVLAAARGEAVVADGREIGARRSEIEDERAAHAEADRPDARTLHLRPRLQPLHGLVEVVERAHLIQLSRTRGGALAVV